MNGWTQTLDTLVAPEAQPHLFGERALQWSVGLWFAVTLIGQWIFAWYIITTYWLPLGADAPARWDSLTPDYSFAFIAHIGLALGIFAAGPLQLIPQLRANFPRFHHWNGRIYVFSVAIASISGLYMIWLHSDVGGIGVQLGTSFSAVLSGFYGWRAIRFAMARQYIQHRRYALRLFMTGAAVWFFRIQLMLWLMISGGKGIDPETFHGPALVIVSFTQYLIPLLMLELYFVAAKDAGNPIKIVFSTGLFIMTLLMVMGLYAASAGMWFPNVGTA
jgi:hypothetical protein